MDAIPVPKHKFSHVHMDLVGPWPRTAEGHTHLLTIVDRTTRWGGGNSSSVNNSTGGGSPRTIVHPGVGSQHAEWVGINTQKTANDRI